MTVEQGELVFFGPRHCDNAAVPTDEEKKRLVDRNCPTSPFSRFIGNDSALRKMSAAAYTALGRDNHQMQELAFSIFGASSTGKTTLVRLYVEITKLPYMEISPKSLRTPEDLFKIMQICFDDEGVPLIEQTTNHYSLPPCVIFIDEVHALSNGIVDSLLKATEFNDAKFMTETGKIIDTKKVTWMIATTDEGKLFDAFRTRFSPIVLKLLNKSDVSKIVKLANKDLPDEVCALVAHYNSRVPRKALEFARYMRMVSAMQPTDSWEAIAMQVAEDEGIDKWGMHETHLKILKALGHGPIAKARIALIAGRKEEEVDRNILPWLLTETDDQAPLIGVSQRGYVITTEGLAELERRGIPHAGPSALNVGV